jgi:hypothetical protein
MFRPILIIILCCYGSVVLAEEVKGLYESTVAIADQSEKSKREGIKVALSNVLVKLTGNSLMVTSSEVNPLLQNAEVYVDALSFQDLSRDSLLLSDPDPDVDAEVGLNVNFSKIAIDQLVRQMQLPVLPSNRPKFLFWIIKDDSALGREFLGEEALNNEIQSSGDGEIVQNIDAIMANRGIPYILPTYDLQDQLALTIDEAWSLDADLIDLASQRYITDGWIALRFYRASSGDIRGAWLYQAAGSRQSGDFAVQKGSLWIESQMDGLLNGLTSSFSYLPRINSNALLLKVNGIDSYEDYRRVFGQLEKLDLVKSAELFSVQGPQVIVSVAAEGGAELLHQALQRSEYFRSTTGEWRKDSQYLIFDWLVK